MGTPGCSFVEGPNCWRLDVGSRFRDDVKDALEQEGMDFPIARGVPGLAALARALCPSDLIQDRIEVVAGEVPGSVRRLAPGFAAPYIPQAVGAPSGRGRPVANVAADAEVVVDSEEGGGVEVSGYGLLNGEVPDVRLDRVSYVTVGREPLDGDRVLFDEAVGGGYSVEVSVPRPVRGMENVLVGFPVARVVIGVEL